MDNATNLGQSLLGGNLNRSLTLAIAFAFIGLLTAARGEDNVLPAGFIRLDEIAPTIRQDIRYAGAFNFTGRRVPGYEAPRCILWRPAAEALARAQAQLTAEGFHLKVYDCYRPARAVQAFVAWSQAPGEDRLKSVFYPDLDKGHLFALGYIAAYSKHSLGIAVDIGLVRADEAEQPTPSGAGRCDGAFEVRARESSLDFGTAFDCFSELSATSNKNISAPARANRGRLLRALKSEGFRNYSREWWHFELNRADAPTTPRDFLVR
ncbi:MAG: M15 family metallopeptidase [Xanthobacteraceae bacterium]